MENRKEHLSCSSMSKQNNRLIEMLITHRKTRMRYAECGMLPEVSSKEVNRFLKISHGNKL
jgi:hypothetical protein